MGGGGGVELQACPFPLFAIPCMPLPAPVQTAARRREQAVEARRGEEHSEGVRRAAEAHEAELRALEARRVGQWR